ncbi:MAG: GGDEF domain-containing protein, partial [Lachnospiraceae bacterium]|nr:GGDEF domain-containing protein [Lachnospiraceae bacterium]
YFIMLTRAKYLVELKNYEDALSILTEMLNTEEIVAYGFEPDIYTLLKTIYSDTGDNENLNRVYEKLLTMNEEFENDIQREYLEFSSYYKENSKLKAYNTILTRRSTISILVILIFCLVLVIVGIILNILARRNITDHLTGVYNRKKLNRLIKQYNHFGTPADLAVIMMDIDYFKKYNDTYGHPEGDKALKKVAKILSASVRSKDVVIRYGGEEFLILTHDVTAEIADTICKRINHQINDAMIPHQASEIADHLTLSIGFCHQKNAKTMSFEALVEEADQCLYYSKKNGRNQFTGKYI